MSCSLGACLQDQVERRLGCTSEPRETALCDDVAEPGLAGLGAEPQADLLGQRRRCVDLGGRRIIKKKKRGQDGGKGGISARPAYSFALATSKLIRSATPASAAASRARSIEGP